jgi:hypothetical protein
VSTSHIAKYITVYNAGGLRYIKARVNWCSMDAILDESVVPLHLQREIISGYHSRIGAMGAQQLTPQMRSQNAFKGNRARKEREARRETKQEAQP